MISKADYRTVSYLLVVAATALAATSHGSAAVAPAVTCSGTSCSGPIVELSAYGSAGMGGNDTAIIQSAIDDTSSRGLSLHIPPASAGSYNVSPLWLRSNTRIILDAGTDIYANTGYGTNGDTGSGSGDKPWADDKMINIRAVSNVQILGNGATLHMRKSEYTSYNGQNHCIDIRRGTNIFVWNISCNDSGGDGIYIGEDIGDGQHLQSDTVFVEDSTFNNNTRQGTSLTAGQNIYYRRNTFSNTNGKAPQAGVDIEPNLPDNPIVNIWFDNNTFSGNRGDGMRFDAWFHDGSSPSFTVNIRNTAVSASGGSDYHALCQTGTPGTIVIDHSSSTNASTSALWYDNRDDCPNVYANYFSVTNPNRANNSFGSAAIALNPTTPSRGAPAGGLHMWYTSISNTKGKMNYYFDFASGGLGALTDTQFLSPVNLSGARYGTGIVSGVKVGTTYSSPGSVVPPIPVLPPNPMTNPFPAIAATNIALTPTLSWTGDASTYDVYLDTSMTPKLVVALKLGSSSIAAGTLLKNTTYYWQVIAQNANGATPSPVWSFTTGAQ